MKILTSHSPQWAPAFQKESALISSTLGDVVSAIHHIGSTAIPGIYAKPIIDLLVEVCTVNSIDTKNLSMVNIGYECMGEYGIAGRRYFRKISAQGVRTHHVHMFDVKSEHTLRHLAFRDYLIAHPMKAQEYSSLKQTLVTEHKGDWDLYLDGKDPFIKKTEQLALEWSRKQI